MITWHAGMTSAIGCMQFHPSHQIWFACLFWNLWYRKLVIQSQAVLKNETENNYYKVMTSVTDVYHKVCQVLQSASGITKCGRLLLQSASGITKCDNYYKVRRNRSATFLQPSSSVGFTVCAGKSKVSFITFWFFILLS